MATTHRGYLAGKKRGKTVKLTHANQGGIAVGDKHADPSGGISGEVGTEKRPIKFEGREVVITAAAVEDPTLIEYEGEKMTRRQALSKINVSGGGVSFADGGEVPGKIRYKKGQTYKMAGESMTVPEIVKYCGCGCAHSSSPPLEGLGEANMANKGMTMQSVLNQKGQSGATARRTPSAKPDIYLKDEGEFITVIFDSELAREKAFNEGLISKGGAKVNIGADQVQPLKRWATGNGLSMDDSEIDEYKRGGDTDTRYQIKGPNGYYIRELASGKVHFVPDPDQAYFFDQDEAEDSADHLKKLGFNDLRIVPYSRTLIMQELAAGGTLDRRARDYALLEKNVAFTPHFARGGSVAFEDWRDSVGGNIETIIADSGCVIDDKHEQGNSLMYNLTSNALDGNIGLKQRQRIKEKVEKLPGVDFVLFDTHLLRVDYDEATVMARGGTLSGEAIDDIALRLQTKYLNE